MAIETRNKPMSELLTGLETRRDKQVVVFGSSIPKDALETIKMLRKASDEYNGNTTKEPPVTKSRVTGGVSRKRRAEFFNQKIG